MCKVKLEDYQNVDYIYCIDYEDDDAVPSNFQPLEVTDNTVSCHLSQRQRSSQQILDLADYLEMHTSDGFMRKYDFQESFSSDIPLWIELVNPNSFFEYFKDKFDCDDVMLIHYNYHHPNLNEIEEFCRQKKWRCTSKENVKGSEASVSILYDFTDFAYEFLTRAKTQLVIVTIDRKWWNGYFL